MPESVLLCAHRGTALMQQSGREISVRDWLGWLFAVLLALIGALSTIAWNGVKDRVDKLENYGSTPLRLEVSELKTKVGELQRQVDNANREVDDLRDQLRALQFRYEPNAVTPSRPKFER